jgi:hypothetical protein
MNYASPNLGGAAIRKTALSPDAIVPADESAGGGSATTRPAGGDPRDTNADPLRLDACPACTYDLTGLPDVGNCPECGAAFDRHADEVVLFGTADGKLATITNGSNRTVLIYLACIAASLFPLLLVGGGPLWSDPFLIMLIGILVVKVAVMLSLRSAAAAAGPVRVRVGIGGFEQASTVPPNSGLWRILDGISLAALLLWAAFMFSHGGAGSAVMWGLMAIVVVGHVVVRVRNWRSGRNPAAVAPVDRFGRTAGVLRPWSTVEKADLRSLGDGRFRVRLSGRSWFDTVDYVDAAIAMTADQAAALGRRIDRWRSVQTLGRPARTSIWRRLGARVGRWTPSSRR